MQNIFYSMPNSKYGTPQKTSISTKSSMNNQNQIMENEVYFGRFQLHNVMKFILGKIDNQI